MWWLNIVQSIPLMTDVAQLKSTIERLHAILVKRCNMEGKWLLILVALPLTYNIVMQAYNIQYSETCQSLQPGRVQI